jgi:type IV pilus assembly protein PilW
MKSSSHQETRMRVRVALATPQTMRGLSLIELMIALLLGLLVVAGAGTIFLSNKRAYGATESLGRVQENARVAFELMARDIREAGASLCGNDVQVANILNDQTSPWWLSWGEGVHGYTGASTDPMVNPARAYGTGAGERVLGTDALDMKGMADLGILVSSKMPPNSANIDVNTVSGINNNDVLMICDGSQMTIFQVTQTPAGLKIQKNPGNGTPGNCTKGMGSPVNCKGPGTDYLYGPNSIIAAPRGLRWYVGYNGRNGGKSLYRSTLKYVSDTSLTDVPQEIAEGVSDMKLSFLSGLSGGTAYQVASAGTDWTKVTAVQIGLTLQGNDKVSTSSGVLQRQLTHVVTLRNRLP